MNTEFDAVINGCKSVFVQKMQSYGISWFCMRHRAFAFQLYMKCTRIRSIQNGKHNSTNESVLADFQAIANYCLMWLVKIDNNDADDPMPEAQTIMNFTQKLSSKFENMYDVQVFQSLDLLHRKNKNYEDIWRSFDIATLTDFITVKVYRLLELTKSPEFEHDLQNISIIKDIINYSIFSIIQINDSNRINRKELAD